MNIPKPCVVIAAVVLLAGCSKKAPEIPVPEPTAVEALVATSYAPAIVPPAGLIWPYK